MTEKPRKCSDCGCVKYYTDRQYETYRKPYRCKRCTMKGNTYFLGKSSTSFPIERGWRE